MHRKQIGVFSALFFFIPWTIILLYFWGAFGETGIFPLHHTQSTPLLWGAIVCFIFSICYLYGKMDALKPYTSITREQDGKVARAVKGPGYREEYFIRAEPEKMLREVLKAQWPFDEVDADSAWRAVDNEGNDITSYMLSEFEGTVEIIFEDEYGLDR